MHMRYDTVSCDLQLCFINREIESRLIAPSKDVLSLFDEFCDRRLRMWLDE